MRAQELLNQELALPEGHAEDRIVQWHVFRTRHQAEAFVPGVKLGKGQSLTGGFTRDSIGPLWWVGVQVDDVGQWGNLRAVNKHGASP